jgi:predicted DNA binding CopG/RHH family protein
MSRKIPKFRSEEEERKFWDSADSTDYISWEKSRKVAFPKLKPSVRTISLRLPEMMLEDLKLLANKRDVPYQSLMKIFLAERIEREFRYPDSEKHKDEPKIHDKGGSDYGKKKK